MKNSLPFENIDDSHIAIIGMAGRFPGADTLDAFWSNLQNGVESVAFFDDEQLSAAGVRQETVNDPYYVKARPLLEGIELFDADFFGYSPSEAACMDPQHRLFLECAWEAIENAGYDPERFKGAISVYAGSSRSSYLYNNLMANPKAMASAGQLMVSIANSEDSLATRIAYKLDLKGACYTIQTFCSTSLVAVHMACQSLLNLECDIAIAGGVSIFVPQNTGYWFERGNIVSQDGHCRPFDARAKGTIFGNGFGAVVLKSLKDALIDGDHINAVIIGSATNNDGSSKVSYTAPSVTGQAEVIAEALANADVNPETIRYIEAHGTGTALGDPAEVSALTHAFRSETQKKRFCALGSVKSNIGHLDRAGGVAGLIKTVLALKHRSIPPTVHFETPNPEIDFENSPFYVNNKPLEWQSNGTPRRAGVSSFGVGGTNAHLIVEEAPVIEPSNTARPYQLLMLSARTESALTTATENLLTHFTKHPDVKLQDVAYTLQVGRKAFNHRRILVCRDTDEAISMMESDAPQKMVTSYQENRNQPVTFVFSGQGAQYVNMGLDLYQSEKIFREQIDLCTKIIESEIELDLRDILYPTRSNIETAKQKIKQTIYTQPALFIIEYALSRLWMSWGINPSAMLGHSIGEYVAATLSGVFSLKDALSLVTARGKLIQALPKGAMLAVFLSEKQLQHYLDEELSLASINAPSICTVAGEKAKIEALQAQLKSENIFTRLLNTSHAYHSHMLDPIIGEFHDKVSVLKRNVPQIPFLSNVSGTWIRPEEAIAPDYWCRHLRMTVRFSDCIDTIANEGKRIFLEVGPGNTTSMLVKQHASISKTHTVLSSTRHPNQQESDIAVILKALGILWCSGVDVDWEKFYSGQKRYRVPLPTYPFERKRFWVEPAAKKENGHSAANSFELMSDLIDTFGDKNIKKYLKNSAGFTKDEISFLQNMINSMAVIGYPEKAMTSIDKLADQMRANQKTNKKQIVKLKSDRQKKGIRSQTSRQTDLNEFMGDSSEPEIKTIILEIWREVLGIKEINAEDNFFELGGNSLTAVRLFAQIEKRIGRKLPLATLYEAPTLGQFSNILGDKGWSASWNCLVEIQKGKSKPNLFLMHSHGGNVLEYYRLSYHLGQDQPVYALQAKGLDGNIIEKPTIKNMVHQYIEEIKRLQPHGPYYIGGFCMGGLLAMEAAQTLISQGERITLLILIHTSSPAYHAKRPSGLNKISRKYYSIKYKFDVEISNLSELSTKSKFPYLLQRAIKMKGFMLAKIEKLIEILFKMLNLKFKRHSIAYYLQSLSDAHLYAFRKHQPTPYEGDVVCVNATGRPKSKIDDPHLGMQELLTGNIVKYEVPGYQQNILNEPNVEIVAQKIRYCLEHTQSGKKTRSAA